MKEAMVTVWGVIIFSFVMVGLVLYLLYKANESNIGKHQVENQKYIQHYKEMLERQEAGSNTKPAHT